MKKESQGTTKIGFINRNGQITIRDTGESGTDFGARKFQMACSHCGYNYGANSTDIWERKCPRCQKGEAGLPIALGIPEEAQSGVDAFFGTWPGKETDEELLAALDDVRGKRT